MTTIEFLRSLMAAETTMAVEEAIAEFTDGNTTERVPLGRRENNRGIIEVSADPGRSLVERITNGIDAVLEAEHDRHGGIPKCRSPKEAAISWLNVPPAGLSELTPIQRQHLANRILIRVRPGEGRESRIVEVVDAGTGMTPEDMPGTILSLNESNKMQKHYLAGAYGQGGSSTLAVSKYTLIASRPKGQTNVGFSVAFFEDLPPEDFKTGRYVYLATQTSVFLAEIPENEFPIGTLVKHFGYDLSGYPSPLGPNSVYGLLNQTLFDPVLPVWFDNRVHKYRRVIKGSRNALNGAVDEGDDKVGDTPSRTLDHSVPMFYVELGEYGRIGIEYWVLPRPTVKNKIPIAAFVNPKKPIILTLNGQDHAELPQSIVRKEAEIPYLANRLICHVDSDSLTATAKRILFVSNREDVRRGVVYDLIQKEIIRIFTSDDELERLNDQAREHTRKEQDQNVVQQMRLEVARLLRLQGVQIAELSLGAVVAGNGNTLGVKSTHRGKRPVSPKPLELHDPPTYIRIVWDDDRPITFYPGQRRYVRLETDANSNYHDATDASASRINAIISGDSCLQFRGSTPLKGGRMRLIIEATSTGVLGRNGDIRVELSRPGQPTLSDSRVSQIVQPPPAKPGDTQLTLPPFALEAVGPEDEMWSTLGWPDDVTKVASSAMMDSGKLMIYYSTAYPAFAARRTKFEQRTSDLSNSFSARYEIWLAVHSLLVLQDAQIDTCGQLADDQDDGAREVAEQLERCRIATMSALFAVREVQSDITAEAEAAGV